MAKRFHRVFLDGVSAYRKGDPAPEGYIAWHSWADVQHKAGLGQSVCSRCSLYQFPQELDADATALAGKPVCRACAEKGGRDGDDPGGRGARGGR